MNIFRRILVAMMMCGLYATSKASDPLTDMLAVDERIGVFKPEKGYWVGLPRTERLRALARAQMCTAIGGPVGQFRLREDEIWLVGLYKCGGDVPLQEVYPDAQGPFMAEWLTGTFFVHLDHLCRTVNGENLFGTTLKLELLKGVVQKTEVENQDKSACPRG